MLDKLLNTNTFAFDIADSATTDGTQPDAAAQAPGAVQAEGPAFAVPTPIAGEFRVNTFTTGDQSAAAVTALDGGGFLVTWHTYGQEGSDYGVFGQRYTAAGVSNGSEFRINTFTSGDQFYASASALIGGGFVVTWSSDSQDGSGYGIYGQRYTAAGVQDGGEFRINTATASNQIYSTVTTLSDGGFVVTWTANSQDGSGDGIYGQRYTSAGVADGSEFRVNTYTLNSQFFSAVAALDNGGFVITWMSAEQDGSSDGLYAQRYTSAGVADGSEFRVNTSTASTQAYPSVAGLDGGGFVVTWSDGIQDGSSYGIYGQRYTAAGVADGGEFRINTNTNFEQFFSSVTALNSGGFLVTWSSLYQDGDGFGIYGQRYDAAGVADGAEFRVSETTAGDQFNDAIPHQSVTQLADGSVVATWFGNGIGDTGGVFARRFSLEPVNAAPAGTDATLTITEDTPRVLTVADFGFTDTDGNALLSVGITTLPAAGTIRLNGTAVTAGTFVTAADINAGLLVYTPGSNGNGTAYSSFTFQVRDNGGGTDTDLSANTITFDVTAVNDAPTIANLQGDVSTQTEGVGTTTFADAGRNAVITDVDSANFDGGQLIVAVTAGFKTGDAIFIIGDGVTAVGAGNVVTVNGIAVGVLNGGSSASPPSPTLTIDLNSNATVALVQTLLRGIFVRDPLAESRGGTRDITATLSDGDGGTNSYTSQLVVNAINDEPSGTDRTITINEDAARALTVADFGFLDTTTPFNFGEGDTLAAVFITTLPAAGTLYIDTDGAGTGALGTAVAAGQRVAVADINGGRLVYVPVANANGAAAASFTFQVQDNNSTNGTAAGSQDTDQSANTLTFNVTAVNDAPELDLNTGTTGVNDTNLHLEGSLASGIGAAIAISDDGGTLTRATVTITDAIAGDMLTVNLPLPAGITVDPASTATTLILVGNASTSAFATALGQVTYSSTSDNPTAGGTDTSRSISVVVNDGAADSAPATMTMTVAAVNDAPVVTMTPFPIGPAFDQFTLNTSNGWNISSFVQAENFTLSAARTLNIFNVFLLDTGSGAATFDGFSGALSFRIYANDGTGQPGTVLFTGADLAPVAIDSGVNAFGRDIYQFAVNLGGIALPAGSYWIALHEGAWASASDGTDLYWMFSANDLTGNTHLSTDNETAPEGTYAQQVGGLAFSFSGPTEQLPYGLKGLVTVSDVDAGSGVLNVTLSVGYGVIDVAAGTSGATIVSGNGTGSVVVSGTLVQLNALLNTDGTSVVNFTANTDAPPANTSFSVSVNDNGNTGGGGPQTAMASQTIVITAINDAPVADLNGAGAGIDTTASYTEGGTPVSPITDIVLSDPDNANLTGATVRIATGFVAGDLLRLSAGLSGTTASGITFSYNSGTGVLTLSGSASVADYQAALATLSFKTNNDAPGTARNITVVINDGAASSTAANIALTVTPVNDAPVADLNGAAPGINTTASYTEGGAAVSPIAGIVLSDPDSANLTGATVAIGAGFVAGDVLRLSGGLSGTTASGITFSYNATTGVLKLRGSASVTDYQAALATLSFKSGSDDPGTARDITVVVNDGTANSVAAQIALTVTPVNDAPVNIVPADQTTTSSGSIVFSTANGNALSVSDPDVGSGQLRVKLAATNGTVTLGDATGVTATGDGTAVVVITGTAAAINAALQGLIYQSSPGYTGPASLKLTTSDLGNTGTGGVLTDVDTVAISVQPQNVSQEPGLAGAFDLTGLAPKTAGAAAVFDFEGLAGLDPDPGAVGAISLDVAVPLQPAVWHDPLHSASDFML